MPNYKLIVSFVAVAVLGATIATAAVVRERHEHGGRSDETGSGAWHQERCADRLAHNVGRIASLESRLALSDTQRPAFETWKSAVLAAANSRKDNCVAHTADVGGPPTILDREAREELMLKTRLAAMDAELPSLKSLYQILTPEQKAVFDKPKHGHEGHGGRDGDDWGSHRHDARGDDGSKADHDN